MKRRSDLLTPPFLSDSLSLGNDAVRGSVNVRYRVRQVQSAMT